MLHPSYSDLMKVVNSEVEPGEAPVVNSRYSIVMATSKRARQLISGEDALIGSAGKKPLSTAVEELNQGKIKILTEEEARQTRSSKPEVVIDLGDMTPSPKEATNSPVAAMSTAEVKSPVFTGGEDTAE